MKQNLFKAVRILFFLAIGAILLLLAFRDVNTDDLVTGLRTARYEWVLLSLLFAFMAFISRTLRWIMLIEPLGYKPPVDNTFYAVMTGYLANFLLPRLGEVTRCGSLYKTDRIPVDSLLGTVITERIIDLMMVFILLGAAFFINISFFGDFLLNNIMIPIIERLSSFTAFSWSHRVIILSTLIILFVLYRFFRHHFFRISFFRRIGVSVNSMIEGMKTILKMKNRYRFILHTLFIWLMYFFMTWAILPALNSTSGLGAADALFLLVVGGLGMAIPVQGGIGAYHLIISLSLTLYGIPREGGLVFATLSHESQALLIIFLGAFSLFMIFMKQKEKNRKNEQPG